MGKEFTVTGNCVPRKHYMADTSEKLAAVMDLVERGKYFSINCPRQYGKTTTLSLLSRRLPEEYIPIRISFEGTSQKMFENETEFCQGLLSKCNGALARRQYSEAELWEDATVTDFNRLNSFITKICRDKKFVLMIDEVDKTSNNLIFLTFLGMLREKFLLRNDGEDDTFHSVILAGVYDIKNLKIKIHQSGHSELKDGEARINSPWNIAVDFKVDMSLSVKDISSMLADYKSEHAECTMDIEAVAKEIRAYTNGYPYLVSRICMKIENDLNKDWTINGVEQAIRLMQRECPTLVDDIAKNLANNKDLDDMMYGIVALGDQHKYDPTNITMGLGLTFGFLIKMGDDITVGNKFFEMVLYTRYAQRLYMDRALTMRTVSSDVVLNGKLNMPLTIEKFARHFYEIYKEKEAKFMEDQCRLLFITYLQPLINGVGQYYVEVETRNARRMDILVNYAGEQFIIELKIWRGETKHEEALDQIVGYLNSKNKDVGYLLTFDFRKENNTGAPKMAWVDHGGKRIFDVMVGV